MSLLSVIVPCYNEEESVALFYRELTKNDPFFKEKEIELELLYMIPWLPAALREKGSRRSAAFSPEDFII